MPGFFLYNASAGSAAKHPAEQLMALLREGGDAVELHEFRGGDRPHDLVKLALERGATWVAIAGGDGTIEDGAKALLGTNVPLGIIPCGTFNNFALSTDTPKDPCDACRVVARGHSRPIDVGFVNDRPFFECVGVGLDAALFPVGEEIKSGGFLRWLEFLRRAYAYRSSRVEIEFDRPVGEALVSEDERHLHRHLKRIRSRSLRIRALMITISNGPYYGMNFTVAPDARVDDGRLTVGVFKRFSKLALWRHFFSISFGKRSAAPELLTFRTEGLQIRGRHRLPVHCDGSPIELWPVCISLKKNILRVFSGEASSL